MPDPICALQLRVRGGLNNQRECIINAAMMSRRLGLSFIVPNVDLVGRGNEKFEPSPRPHYAEPWSTCGNRSTGCSYELLFPPLSNVALASSPQPNGRIVTLPPTHVAVPDSRRAAIPRYVCTHLGCGKDLPEARHSLGATTPIQSPWLPIEIVENTSPSQRHEPSSER